MNIHQHFDHFKNSIKDCETLLLVDSDGETILKSSSAHIEEYDVQLFGAQIAVVLSNTVEDKNADFIFMTNDNKSAAVKRLENGYFVCLSFDKPSFNGYAEKWLDEVAEVVKEEFF